MLKGFKEFLLRGNVIDLAVAVVIGAAFTAVVTSFTKSFLEPLLRLFSGGDNAIPPGTIPLTDEVQLDYASFLNAIVTFFITAGVIYFLVVFPMKWLQERRKKGQEEDVEPTDTELLTEIRDLLRVQAERDAARDGGPTAFGRGLPDPASVPSAPGTQQPATQQHAAAPHAAAPVPAGHSGRGPAEAGYEPYPDTPQDTVRARHSR